MISPEQRSAYDHLDQLPRGKSGDEAWAEIKSLLPQELTSPLPKEPGTYVDAHDRMWELMEHGTWRVLKPLMTDPPRAGALPLRLVELGGSFR